MDIHYVDSWLMKSSHIVVSTGVFMTRWFDIKLKTCLYLNIVNNLQRYVFINGNIHLVFLIFKHRHTNFEIFLLFDMPISKVVHNMSIQE